jgi:hypothetical protein
MVCFVLFEKDPRSPMPLVLYDFFCVSSDFLGQVLREYGHPNWEILLQIINISSFLDGFVVC